MCPVDEISQSKVLISSKWIPKRLVVEILERGFFTFYRFVGNLSVSVVMMDHLMVCHFRNDLDLRCT